MSGIILVFLILFLFQAATGYWWWVLVVPFFCGAFRSRTTLACVRSSSIGAGLLWLLGAVFALLTDGGRIASRVAEMGGFNDPLLAVLLSGLVAALAGGLSGLAGFQIKKLLGKDVAIPKLHTFQSSQRRTKKYDRVRTRGEDQETRATPIPGRTRSPRAD